MKKAKIMLTAITVLAVVGGALAFKATTTGQFHLCTTSDFSSGVCNIDAPNVTVVSPGSGAIGYTVINEDQTCGDVQFNCLDKAVQTAP